MKNVKPKWILIAVIAALVASLTTVVILVLRARAKKKAMLEEEYGFGYDLEDDDAIDWEMMDGEDTIVDELVAE